MLIGRFMRFPEELLLELSKYKQDNTTKMFGFGFIVEKSSVHHGDYHYGISGIFSRI